MILYIECYVQHVYEVVLYLKHVTVLIKLAVSFGLYGIGFITYQAKAESTSQWLNMYTRLLMRLSKNENNFW